MDIKLENEMIIFYSNGDMEKLEDDNVLVVDRENKAIYEIPLTLKRIKFLENVKIPNGLLCGNMFIVTKKDSNYKLIDIFFNDVASNFKHIENV